jgi:hypothetical protein
MEVFKIKTEDEGKVFIIRPLLNAKNINDSITKYKIRFGMNFSLNGGIGAYEWFYRYMCFALVNDELKIFNFSKEIYKLLFIDKIPKLLFMDSNKVIKVTVGVREGFLDNKYEIIEDDKFRFDNTSEKKEFIKNLLTTTELDLLEATKQEKLKIGHLEIKLPKYNGGFSVKTLQEIYDFE